MSNNNTRFRLGATRPSAREISVAIEVLQSLVPPANGREVPTAKERRERVADITRALCNEYPPNVVKAIEQWSVELTPPEEDSHCEEQRQRQAAIEDLALKLTDAAIAFYDAVADWEAHDPDECEDCNGARLDAAMARKGDDE